MLCPSGSHPRKNNERIVGAWSRLGDAAWDRQLVITGELPESTAHHLRHLASQTAVADPVVVTGFVGDDDLVALYQGADLVCFPSLAEGFGLPVAEARACGVTVVCSDRPPLDELVAPENRFDPEDVDDIARVIAAALGRHDPGAAPSRDLGRIASWPEVAARSAEVFEDLVAGSARRTRPRGGRQRALPRVAFVTPLPPAPSGVAAYNFRLIEELVATNEVTLDVFADGPTPSPTAPAGATVYAAPALAAIERLTGRYDRVVYTLGNSHHHLGALALLRQRPGVVVSHDVRLTNLYRHETGDPGLLPHGLAGRIREMYGESLPPCLGAFNEVGAEDLARYGLLMAREAIGLSEVFLVTSRAAAALARVDAGPLLAGRVDILPFAVESPRDNRSAFAETTEAPDGCPIAARWWGRSPEPRDDQPVVAHFGIVDPVKAPELLVDAFAALVRGRGTTTPRCSPSSGRSRRTSLALADRASARGSVTGSRLTGPLPQERYRWLAAATLAVQLRRSFNGEASAAVGECLASGVPTVATNLGWLRELPGAAVELVPAAVDAEELASVLAGLLTDPARRRLLAGAGRDFAAHQTFAATAHALLAAVLPERAMVGVPRPGT